MTHRYYTLAESPVVLRLTDAQAHEFMHHSVPAGKLFASLRTYSRFARWYIKLSTEQQAQFDLVLDDLRSRGHETMPPLTLHL